MNARARSIPGDRLMYSPSEVAHLISVSDRTIWRWIKSGQIQAIKIGGARRIPSSEVQRILLRDAQVEPLPQVDHEIENLLRELGSKMAV